MKEILGHLLIAGFFTSFLVLSGCDNLTGDEGERGPAGASGADAQPCIVTDNLDGTFTQACPGSASVSYGETEEPEAYDNATAARGGQLYDTWWIVTGASEPTTTHAFYPPFGEKSGSDTWRCTECHGWDYIGKDGGYRTGSHYTGIDGLYPNLSSVWVAYKNIRDNHGYGDAGLTDADVWDLVKFYREELIDI